MADSILRLRVQSDEYDSKIKRAQQGLLHFEDACRKAGKSMNDMEKDQKQFVQSLGSMQTVSTSVRGKIGELSNAFVELRSQYNRLTDEEKKGDFGRALSGSLEQLKTRVQAAKAELKDIQKELDSSGSAGGGGFLSGMGGKMSGALQVFAGNMMTKAAGAVASLGSEMADMVKQGIELAKQGEGIRIAFERLGRGDILDGLREATHGTVTDIELMKAAVKFNDFRLPLDELGTMLAFAQQKAKDTGQSVDYMVDSIVTGLGRKSLMILDNLGLSASEIKERMAETGDMTKAVGAIIRDQMAKAGDYVETAADRAAQANVSLQNKMEELGRKFAPVQEASNQLWTSMKIGILDVVGGPLARLLNGLTEAGRMRNALSGINAMGGEGQTLAGKHLDTLRQYSASHSTADVESLAKRQVARYAELEAQEWKKYNQQKSKLNQLRSEYGSGWGVGGGLEKEMEASRNRALAWRQVSAEYQAGAKQIVSPVKPVIDTSEAEQSITSLTKKLNDLQEQRKKAIAAGDTDLSKNLLKQINQTKADIKGLDGSVSTSPTHKATKEVVSQMKLPEFGTVTLSTTESMKELQAQLAAYKQQLASATNVIDSGEAQRGIEQTQKRIEAQPLALRAGLDVDSVVEVQDNLDSLLADMRSNIKPLEVGVNVGGTNGKGAVKTAQDTADAWKAAAQAISNAGSAMQNIEDPAAQVAGIVMQAIANIALGFAQASASPATGAAGVFGWIAAVTAGLATMTATIASIKSTTKGGFAEGGIVPGNSYSGDNLRINDYGINSGELVLTRAQTNSLAAQLTDGDGRGAANTHPYVNGEQIYLGLTAYLRRSGRGELVMSR